ncbi:MAG: MSEP-CTERM sorting domain-containing protein [Lentisphaerae bacterium RIFOXYC12_FULL_60_16]|nr:MAG: MSEP-CTERM sorting domain-containing protein [Lentisphaerae bacterium RIFOXYC12_FULL_60_16]
MHDPDDVKPLLPALLRKPVMLVWAVVVPLLAFLAGLIRAWMLVAGELNETGKLAYDTVFACTAALIAVTVLVAVALRRSGKPVDWKVSLFLFLVQVGFMWRVVTLTGDLVPDTVADWMLSPQQLLFLVFATSAPALFFYLLHLSGVRLRLGAGSDVGLSLAVLIGVPGSWYLAGVVLSRLHWLFLPNQVIIMVVFFLTTAIMFCAFLRLLLYVHGRLGRSILMAILGSLVFPLGGLLLNASIPFPCDLQDWTVYAMTVLNAVAVLIPTGTVHPGRRLAIWCSRAVTFPFTLYFFLLFLPFLPLSIPAMLAAGGGFLILTPTFLFVVHVRLLLDEGAHLVESMGWGRVVGLFVAMLLVMPGLYTARALYHKAALMQAVHQVFQPDYSEAEMKIDQPAVRQALTRLQNMKDGIYVPMLSDYYNWIVFNGMVLADSRMKTIRRVLLGETADRVRSRRDMQIIDFFSGGGRSRQDWNNSRHPPRHVRLADVQVSTRTTGQVCIASVVLDMQNTNEALAEYVDNMTVPDGVLVSGYWLDVNGQTVPGRIVDRKSAEWVYHMIRDTTRRDPGLLVCNEDATLRLSVYPFNGGETRRCGIDFMFPVSASPEVRIGDRLVSLQAVPAAGPVVIQLNGTQQAVYLSKATSATLPSFTRKPYLHFIVDASGAARDKQSDLLTQMDGVLRRGSNLLCHVTLANAGSRHLTPEPVDGSTALALVRQHLTDPGVFSGGFNAGRALKHAALQYAGSGDQTVPYYVLVTPTVDSALLLEDLEAFQRFKPDTPPYRFAVTVVRVEVSPVHLLQTGDTLGIACADADALVLLGPGAIGVFNPAENRFQPLPAGEPISGDTVYAQGVALWQRYRRTVLDPSAVNDARADLLAISRSTCILQPLAAYIVLENSAQWVQLERAQQQALNADQALAFDESETPAPPVLLLLAGFLLVQAVRMVRARHVRTRSIAR